MAYGDISVRQAIASAPQVGGVITYAGVQAIIRAAFDFGIITVQERADLRRLLTAETLDPLARGALTTFLDHVDKRSGPADEAAKRSGNTNIGMPLAVPDPGPFTRTNTDLGKFSHGNFDVLYIPDEGELWVVLKVKYKFQKGITATEQEVLKWKLGKAVEAWDNVGAYLESKSFVLNPIIRIRFKIHEVSRGAHKTVDVDRDPRREWIGMDINVHKGTNVKTLTHELGHVYGNYDEYRGSGLGGWIERRMYWHDNRWLSDTTALMNGGTQFRARYFDHFQNYVNKQFVKVKAWYGVRI